MSRPKRSRSWWAAKIRAWNRSGLTAARFAAKHRLSENSLRWWKWKLGEGGVEELEERRPERFVEVDVGGGMGPAGLELTSPGGWTIRLPAGFEADELARVVSVMEVRS